MFLFTKKQPLFPTPNTLCFLKCSILMVFGQKNETKKEKNITSKRIKSWLWTVFQQIRSLNKNRKSFLAVTNKNFIMCLGIIFSLFRSLVFSLHSPVQTPAHWHTAYTVFVTHYMSMHSKLTEIHSCRKLIPSTVALHRLKWSEQRKLVWTYGILCAYSHSMLVKRVQCPWKRASCAGRMCEICHSSCLFFGVCISLLCWILVCTQPNTEWVNCW